MKNVDVIRAWKDEEYRLSLSDIERALLPQHPAGGIELTDEQLGGASGGNWPFPTVGFTCGAPFCTFYIGCTSVICPW